MTHTPAAGFSLLLSGFKTWPAEPLIRGFQFDGGHDEMVGLAQVQLRDYHVLERNCDRWQPYLKILLQGEVLEARKQAGCLIRLGLLQ